MGLIQRQTIQSSLLILAGFAIGAVNTLVLYTHAFQKEEYGLTQVIVSTGLLGSMLASLGTVAVTYKFSPFYKSYLPPGRSDLPTLTGLISLFGFLLILITGITFEHLIVRKFSANSRLFVDYYYLSFPYIFFLLVFMWLEGFGWATKKSVLTNGLKEALTRGITTVLLLLAIAGAIHFHEYLWFFSFLYALPALILFLALRKTGEFRFVKPFSPVSRRLGSRMITFALFVFGAQFLNVVARVSDTFFVAAKTEDGLGNAAILTIATYIITLMEIPQRSITGVSVPVLAESWKDKNLGNIQNIYFKSVSNLLVIGLSMFGLLWLNAENLSLFLGKGYSGITGLVFFMGLGKLIDLGTGVNSQIIATSNYWRFDFFTNIIYTLLSLPLNYYLISRFGLIGAAYASLISLTTYNLIRYLFLYKKFGLQPYRFSHVLAFLAGALACGAAYLLPRQDFWLTDAIFRTALFCGLFFPLIYLTNAAPELNKLAEKYISFRKK